MDQVHVVRHKVSRRGAVRAEGCAGDGAVAQHGAAVSGSAGAGARRGGGARAAGQREGVAARRGAARRVAALDLGKQRLTATRLHEMLVAEGLTVGVTTVKAMVVEWKRRRREVFVPLVYHPGDLAEVDFFEVLVDVAIRRG